MDITSGSASTGVSAFVRAKPGVIVREVGAEAVLLDAGSGRYLGFDPIALAIWRAVSTAESVTAAVERLVDEFDAAPDVLEADVHDFLDELVGHGLVEVRRP